MITMPISVHRKLDAFVYLEEEYDRGTVDHHIDGKYRIFTFYDPEDEAAFVLKFGNSFMSYAEDVLAGVFYTPYIPVGFE
jgi:hypothetical protein